jgi:fructose-1,6-bisphosphatase/inositol monophosphatase family enzyme
MLIFHSTSVGEEHHVAGTAVQLEDNFTWIIDPIDGKLNGNKAMQYTNCGMLLIGTTK